MRIISQDGMLDMPYENMIVNISYKNKNQIVASGTNFESEDSIITIAEYSTEEKAVKAMELLREAYTGLPIIMRNVDIADDVAEMLKKWEKQGIVFRTGGNEPPKIECVNNGYFRFPADNEIEVQQ